MESLEAVKLPALEDRRWRSDLIITDLCGVVLSISDRYAYTGHLESNLHRFKSWVQLPVHSPPSSTSYSRG